MFDWEPFRKTKATIKLHTLIELHGSIPTFIHISNGKMHDVKVLDLLSYESCAYYVPARGYVDFERLHALNAVESFFVAWAKSNMQERRLFSHEVNRTTGLICDQRIVLEGHNSHKGYPEQFHSIRFKVPKTRENLVFITNAMRLPSLNIMLGVSRTAGSSNLID